ncbi:hypothetical protein AYO44_03330 [Planctomycetaceae bacterium SCGC AG-212-F19]|nr:hypothetical protein AYO44_03330 [Planctomycetaceae bacterium SCGC AG-212-F19]
MRLSLKFTVMILALLLLTIGISASVMISHQREAVEKEVLQRAQTVAAFGEACRDYTQKVLSPAVEKHLGKGTMVFEAQSRTFVARGTMEQFRAREGMKDYSFREASLNPLNEKNLAAPFEAKLIDRFKAEPDLKEQTGFQTLEGQEYFFVARPILVEKSCLRCHDTPERAPAEIVTRYGGKTGFGWKEGDRTNALMISVPTGDLRARQDAAIWKVGGIFGGLAAALVLLMYGSFHFLVSRRLHHTAAVMEEVADNPATTTRIADPSRDEIGSMNRSVNTMLDKILPLMKARQEERDAIQGSVRKLLEEVSGVAEGDLTKQAEVTADATGAVADSFNYMIAQLRKIIGNVQDVSMQVNQSAGQIKSNAEQLARGSEAQASQIAATSSGIDNMANSIQQVSQTATLSAGVAQQALLNARQGATSVQNTIQGMTRIRDQVQETAKRIKRLGESSQEIGQIIQLIDDIADRTSILALNASIQAAMAGEAGRGFAVVAEEVERLADRSAEATKKIATLVKTIQSETGEAVSAMEKGIKEVVDGSRLANNAGQALAEIEAVSNRLAELIQSISLASQKQAQGSEALARSMNEISQITKRTATGTKQAAESVTHLADLADDLRSSVSTFRLPAATATQRPNGAGPAPSDRLPRPPAKDTGRTRKPALSGS